MTLLTWTLYVAIVTVGVGTKPSAITPHSANGKFDTKAECGVMGEKAESVVRNLGYKDRTAIYECREDK